MTTEEHEMRLKWIEQLGDCAGWVQYLRPRLSDLLKQKERTVLENETLSTEELMMVRAEAKVLRYALNLPVSDGLVSRNTLRRPEPSGQS